MGWDKKIKKIKKLLEPKGTKEEIEIFLRSQYFKSTEKNTDNIINDFLEYISDQADWELYVKSVKDGN